MKKLGIIGGAGPFASALMYREIISHIYDQMDNRRFPEIFLINYPFTRGLTCEESSANAPSLVKELQYCIDRLAKNGISIAVIACNTMHTFTESLDLKGIEIISLPDTILTIAEKLQKKRLLILGTQTTKERGVYRHHGIELTYPSIGEQKVVDAVIDRILCGKIFQRDSELISAMVSEIYEREEFDGVVLGCTDLPVLHDHYPLERVAVPIFDSIKSPIETIYKILINNKE